MARTRRWLYLVYLTAAVPDVNQSMAGLAPATVYRGSAAADEGVSEGPVAGPADSFMLEPDPVVAALFNDGSKARARRAVESLRPMNRR